MIQVSLVGYMSAGSFLGLQYFDLFYHLIVIIVAVRALVEKEVALPPHVAAVAPHGRSKGVAGPTRRLGAAPPG
jgi:hypothetical protein